MSGGRKGVRAVSAALPQQRLNRPSGTLALVLLS